MDEKIFNWLSELIGNNLIAACILFAIGLVLLIKGGDWFVDGSVSIAHRFGIPEILIGATIVSVGTTLPEVMVSAASALKGSGDIAYGNAVGSVICNTALIAALTIAIKPSRVDKKSLRLPVIFFFGSAALYLFFAYTFGYFGRIAGTVFLCIYVLYMVITITSAIKSPSFDDENEEKPSGSETAKMFVLLVIGAVLIALGSNLLVDNGMIIAKEANVPESVIALTFVALGTSLPELVTAITSLVKGHGALSLGNIIGANLFDLIFVSGIAPLLSPFAIPSENTLFGINVSLLVDLPVMITVMAILTLPPLIKGKLTRAQGITLLIIYALFCILQFWM